MAIRESKRLDGSLRPPTQRTTQTEPAPATIITTGAAKFLAVFRVTLGFAFLWAFLDKTFGLGYATPSAKAWINGGSPTKGFLSGVAVGPFEATFHSLGRDPLGQLAVHDRPARHRRRADPGDRAPDRGRQRHPDDAGDVGGRVAAGQVHLGR